MTPKDGAAWLPSAWLLLLVPGSLSLRGPRTVTGTVGASLSVQCRYKKEYTENKKYWCKSSCSFPWREKIVETTESARAVRSGRVSIRDDPANLTFTVTLESLTEDDEGTYWCGIDASWLGGVLRDPVFQVVVSVFPARSPKIFTSTPGPPTTLPAASWSSTTRQETLDPSQHHWSLLSSVHFLLLVFLEVPLLLSMLGAVLWVNRPQRSSEGRWSQPNCENQ